MCQLLDLPDVIFRLIHEFFFYPFFSSQRMYTDKEWRDFLNTTKLLSNVKKETIYLYLNQKASLRYLYEDHFRSQILSHMKEPCRQLGINFRNFSFFIPPKCSSSSSSLSSYNAFHYLNNIHYLNLSGVKISSEEFLASGCQEIHEILLSPAAHPSSSLLANNSSLSELPGLQKIHKLILKFLPTGAFQFNFNSLIMTHVYELEILHPRGLTREMLEIISLIPSLKKLILRNGSFHDISMFAHIHDLDLDISNNIWVSNVTPLQYCRRLILNRCRNIIDVSQLGNCQELDLSYTQVSDVGALGKVKILKLRHCKKILEVKKLSQVETLDLSWCDQIKDISMLTSVKKLILHGWDLNRIPPTLSNAIQDNNSSSFGEISDAELLALLNF